VYVQQTEYVEKELFGSVAGRVAGETRVSSDVDELHAVNSQRPSGVLHAQVRMINERDPASVSDPSHCRPRHSVSVAMKLRRATDHYGRLVDRLRVVDMRRNCAHAHPSIHIHAHANTRTLVYVNTAHTQPSSVQR